MNQIIYQLIDFRQSHVTLALQNEINCVNSTTQLHANCILC